MIPVERKERPRPPLILLLALFLLAFSLVACAEDEPTAEEKWAISAHADADAAAFSNWNEADPPETPERCAKCHSTHGYRDFLGDDGSQPGEVSKPAPIGTTIECEACHNEAASAKSMVLTPSGKTIEGLGGEANCMECHQGRASGVDILEATRGKALDTVDSGLSFSNIHNAAAGPTQYGTQANGGFEYTGKRYAERYDHSPEFNSCTECHDAHALAVKAESCGACHLGANTAADLANIRVTNVDYDADGDVSEGIAAEIADVHRFLLQTIQLYAAGLGADITYEDRRPYFFGENGEEFASWTPRLLRAAYNYHYIAKEPGGYAHHNRYQLQLLYDSLENLGAEVRFLTRPES